jgi:hypothetical protein
MKIMGSQVNRLRKFYWMKSIKALVKIFKVIVQKRKGKKKKDYKVSVINKQIKLSINRFKSLNNLI